MKSNYFDYYNPKDALLYLLINVVLISTGIILLTSYLSFLIKFTYVIMFYIQPLMIILGIRYYQNKSFFISINESSIIFNINGTEDEISFNDIDKSYRFLFFNAAVLLKDKRNIILPVFLGHKKNKEIVRLINERIQSALKTGE